jgi:hypothetical protein
VAVQSSVLYFWGEEHRLGHPITKPGPTEHCQVNSQWLSCRPTLGEVHQLEEDVTLVASGILKSCVAHEMSLADKLRRGMMCT